MIERSQLCILLAVVALTGAAGVEEANAQFKAPEAMAIPTPAAPMVTAPITPAPIGMPTPTSPMAIPIPITPAPMAIPIPMAIPTPAAPAAIPTPTPIPMAIPTPVPGCPGRSDCPPNPEGEDALSEAAEEILKEFIKCEIEGKSVEQCLADDPSPPQLSQFSYEDLSRLTQCLGSSNLSATKDRWSGCVAELR
jgi:hypothetical protein